MAVRYQFGRWNEFVEACGFDTYKPYLSELAQQNRNKAKRGKRSTNWKGGRQKNNGYINIWNPEHPNAGKNGYVAEHRMIMSNYLGRPLKREENIHHVDGDRANNDIDNLELWSKAQPAGQRVTDKLEWAINFLKEYGYEVN